MNFFKRNKNTQPVEEQRQEQPQQPQQPVYYSPYSEALLFGQFLQRSPLLQSAGYSSLSLISEAIASLNIYVKQVADGKRTIVNNHKVSRLFYTANLNKYLLIHQLVWDYLLNGNAFAYIHRDNSGKPIKLTYLEFGDVTINYIKQNDTVTYQVTNHNDIPKNVKREDMLHFAKDPKDGGVIGRGFLYFAHNVIKLNDNADQSAENFFSGGCALSGALKFTGRLSDVQKQQIRQNWQQIHAGANASGLVILEGDSDYIPISSNASDSQLLETRQYGVIEIARFFHISPVLLCDLTNSGYSAIEDAQIDFVSHALMPIINLFQEEIDRKLLNDSATFYSNIDETTLLKGNKISQAEYVTKLVNGGIITVNEAREALDYNRHDDEQCDKLFIPFTDISQNTITNTQNEENNEQP